MPAKQVVRTISARIYCALARGHGTQGDEYSLKAGDADQAVEWNNEAPCGLRSNASPFGNCQSCRHFALVRYSIGILSQETMMY